MVEVLVLYYSKTGAVKELASSIARGINSIDGAEAKIRTVPEVSTDTEKTEDMIPKSGALFATLDDLKSCVKNSFWRKTLGVITCQGL